MKNLYTNSRGISEMVSVILIIFLVLILAIIIYVMIFGSLDLKYMQKSVYIAGEMSTIPLDVSLDSDYILTYMPKAGDPFYLIGQKRGNGTPVTMKVSSPDGRNLVPDTSGLTGVLYGKTLYIYQDPASSNSCEYIVSDAKPLKIPPPMVNGIWKIQMIDEQIHILADTYTETFTKGTTSLPVTILSGTGTGGKSYRADCSVTNGTCGGYCPLMYNTSPCNMTYSKFTGSNYLTFPNDPTLNYTGQMSIAVSIRPTTTGDSANSGNWHQIIGKGVTVGVNDENDNYQFFQMGDRLYFEWNDAITGTHYHAMTPTGIIQAGQWNNLDVVVQNGHIAIYDNGVSQPLSYYQSNVPGVNPIAAPTVNLQNNNNSVTIGRQNGGAGNEFYFNGDIGSISLYNRGLTPQDITGQACPG
jgi:hypothetical protein